MAEPTLDFSEDEPYDVARSPRLLAVGLSAFAAAVGGKGVGR